jgi:aspartate kinase
VSAPRRIVVQKYGGSSVATPERLLRVAELVVDKKRAGFELVVVVSAMGDTTDELLEMAKAVSPEPDRRELDMLLSAGERISMSLLAMAIQARGYDAVSLTGSQSGIITNHSHAQARIIEVRPFRIEDELELGRIVIVAGYQGVSYRRDVTTLGRGGSDTTAVALAAALSAEACEIYSDVDGVFTADPRVVPEATKLEALRYEEMQELARAGAKVLNADAVEFAKRHRIAIYSRRTGSPDPGTVVRRDLPTPPSGVRGIAHETGIATLEGRLEGPSALGVLLAELSALGAHPKQVSFNAGAVALVLGLEDVHHLASVEEIARRRLGEGALRTDRGAVSLIGEAITREATQTQAALGLLSRSRIGVLGLSTSSFRITVVLDAADVPRAVRLLHAEFLGAREALSE